VKRRSETASTAITSANVMDPASFFLIAGGGWPDSTAPRRLAVQRAMAGWASRERRGSWSSRTTRWRPNLRRAGGRHLTIISSVRWSISVPLVEQASATTASGRGAGSPDHRRSRATPDRRHLRGRIANCGRMPFGRGL
jgi:hypothetical protein